MGHHHDTLTIPDTPGARKNVLLVEDDEAVARLFVRILRSASHNVVQASDGKVAKRLVEETDFDAIVTDISIPSFDGIDLLRLIRATNDQVPVVLVTGKPDTSLETEVVRHPANRFLTKPVAPTELQRVVAEAIEDHEPARGFAACSPPGTAPPPSLPPGTNTERHSGVVGHLRLLYQPLVCPVERRIIGHEALPRIDENVLRAANGRLDHDARSRLESTLGRKVMAMVQRDIICLESDALVFMDMNTLHLADEDLLSNGSPLAGNADRIVLEISHRACVDQFESTKLRLQQLRAHGFAIAIDDCSLDRTDGMDIVKLHPNFAKIDLHTLPDIMRSESARNLVGSFALACSDANVVLACDGVRTRHEASALMKLGFRVFQGSLYSLPRRASVWTSGERRQDLSNRLRLATPNELIIAESAKSRS